MHKRRAAKKKSAPSKEVDPLIAESGAILARRRGGGNLPRELELNMQTAGVLLVIVEGGANLPSWIGRCQDKVSDVFVLAGSSDERADALLHRVEQRLTLLLNSDAKRGLAVLVTEAGPVTTAVELARLRIAQALLGYLKAHNEGVLLLLTQEDAPLETRVQLLSMAGNLAQQLRGSNISVNVRFGALADTAPPQELFGHGQNAGRRNTRRPPPQSGQMLKPSLMPPLHKVPAILPRRKVSEAG